MTEEQSTETGIPPESYMVTRLDGVKRPITFNGASYCLHWATEIVLANNALDLGTVVMVDDKKYLLTVEDWVGGSE